MKQCFQAMNKGLVYHIKQKTPKNDSNAQIQQIKAQEIKELNNKAPQQNHKISYLKTRIDQQDDRINKL